MATVEKLKLAGPQPLGLHLLMGETAKQKFQNQIRNLRERPHRGGPGRRGAQLNQAIRAAPVYTYIESGKNL